MDDRRDYWQREVESSAHALDTVHRNRAVVRLHDLFCNRKSQARALESG